MYRVSSYGHRHQRRNRAGCPQESWSRLLTVRTHRVSCAHVSPDVLLVGSSSRHENPAAGDHDQSTVLGTDSLPSWNELVEDIQKLTDDARGPWLSSQLTEALQTVAELRAGPGSQARNVIFYASGWLQKPGLPYTAISDDDINGLMSVVYQMDCDQGLTLILHTPGGSINAAETFVAYLRSKFKNNTEVIVPVYAMSAGTMISLSTKRIVLGRQSQLGPIDPQFLGPGGQVSARAVVEQFDQAKKDILAEPALAHLWAPVLQSHGPSLLVEARQALDYGEQMVAKWLETCMFEGEEDAADRSRKVAAHFNDATQHLSHGHRIDLADAEAVGVKCERLEDDQPLQEAVLTAYHIMTVLCDSGPMVKMLFTNQGRSWIRNLQLGPS
jgi:hypothetical protein